MKKMILVYIMQFMSTLMLSIGRWHCSSISYCFAVDALRRTALESALLRPVRGAGTDVKEKRMYACTLVHEG